MVPAIPQDLFLQWFCRSLQGHRWHILAGGLLWDELLVLYPGVLEAALAGTQQLLASALLDGGRTEGALQVRLQTLWLCHQG